MEVSLINRVGTECLSHKTFLAIGSGTKSHVNLALNGVFYIFNGEFSVWSYQIVTSFFVEGKPLNVNVIFDMSLG